MTVMKTHKQEAQDKFIIWAKATHPKLFAAAKSQIGKFKPVSINNVWAGTGTGAGYDPTKFGYNPKRAPIRNYITPIRRTKFAQLNGMGEGWGDFFSELTTGIVALAPQYLQFKQQKDMLDVQVKRARQGLPPVNTAPYVVPPPTQSTPPYQAPMQPQVRPTSGPIRMEAAMDMRPILIGVGVIALVFLLKKKRR